MTAGRLAIGLSAPIVFLLNNFSQNPACIVRHVMNPRPGDENILWCTVLVGVCELCSRGCVWLKNNVHRENTGQLTQHKLQEGPTGAPPPPTGMYSTAN